MRNLYARVVMALGTIAFGSASWSKPLPVTDGTQSFLTFPNFPESDQLPIEAHPTLNDGLALNPGAVSKAALTFTPGGNVDGRDKLDSLMYYNPIFGDQTRVTGEDGIEGDTASSFTRPRRYRKESPFNLLNFTSEGLNLGTICSRNNTAAGCRPGQVYGALIRLPTVILPGDIVSVTMKTGDSPFFYTGPALYAAVQNTPGSGGKPYEGTGALHFNNCYGEISIDDDYFVADVVLGRQLKMGVDANNSYARNDAGQCFKTAPHETYDADGPDFAYHPNSGHPYFEIKKAVTFKGMHTYTCWLTNDGSNLILFFFDGMHVSTEYYEPSLSSFTDASGTSRSVGFSLTIAAQTIPTFLNADHDLNARPYSRISPNDGGAIVGGPWSATIASIKIIHGVISAQALYAATKDVNGTDSQTYGRLKNYSGR